MILVNEGHVELQLLEGCSANSTVTNSIEAPDPKTVETANKLDDVPVETEVIQVIQQRSDFKSILNGQNKLFFS